MPLKNLGLGFLGGFLGLLVIAGNLGDPRTALINRFVVADLRDRGGYEAGKAGDAGVGPGFFLLPASMSRLVFPPETRTAFPMLPEAITVACIIGARTREVWRGGWLSQVFFEFFKLTFGRVLNAQSQDVCDAPRVLDFDEQKGFCEGSLALMLVNNRHANRAAYRFGRA